MLLAKPALTASEARFSIRCFGLYDVPTSTAYTETAADILVHLRGWHSGIRLPGQLLFGWLKVSLPVWNFFWCLFAGVSIICFLFLFLFMLVLVSHLRLLHDSLGCSFQGGRVLTMVYSAGCIVCISSIRIIIGLVFFVFLFSHTRI